MTFETMQTVGWIMVITALGGFLPLGLFIVFFFDPSTATWKKIDTFAKWWIGILVFFIVFPHLYWWFD